MWTFLISHRNGGRVAENSGNSDKERFLYPIGRYYGEFTPEQLAFNANLQEFAHRVSIICGLETGGKIPPQDAYTQIKDLWAQLKASKRNLLDQPPPLAGEDGDDE